MYDVNVLYSQIATAIGWNAFSYTIFKITLTTLTFVLYKQLSTAEFAVWTGINSIVYLISVWADMGMRKTIPTYFPMLQEGIRRKYAFLTIGLYTLALCCACPIALWVVHIYTSKVGLPMNKTLFFASSLLFFGHSLEMLLQTIFHAYLWHKTFNTLLAFIQTLYMAFVLSAVLLLPPSLKMVSYIIIGKGITSFVCTSVCFYLLEKRLPPAISKLTLSPTLLKEFLHHASLMWAAAISKSFSERNITVPFVTFCLGPLLGNLFKVAQDAALLFQRLIFRTIGSTDTSLFAYLKNTHSIKDNQDIFQQAFSQLTTKLAYLTLPLIGLIWFMQCQVSGSHTQNYGFQLFFILSIGLLFELLLTPFERMLEVQRNYRDLIYVYIFYLMSIALLAGALFYGYIHLIAFTILLCCIRLLSMSLMACAVYYRYQITYPLKKISVLFGAIVLVSYVLHILASYFFGITLLDRFTNFLGL